MFQLGFYMLSMVCIVGIDGWTYEAENDVQACRDLLSSNLVIVFTDGDRYILTNVLTGAYMDDEQPVYVRGTRTQRISKNALSRIALLVEEVANERPEYYTHLANTESPIDTTVSTQVFSIGLILMYTSFLLVLWICYRCYRR